MQFAVSNYGVFNYPGYCLLPTKLRRCSSVVDVVS